MRRFRLFGFFALLAFLCAVSSGSTLRGLVKPTKLVYGDRKHESRVKELWRELESDPSACSSCFVELGAILIQERYLDEAIDFLEVGLDVHPDTPQLYFLLSTALESRTEEHDPRSLSLLQDAVRGFPENGDTHLRLGYAYQSLGEHSKAIEAFEESIRTSDELLALLSAHLGLMACFKERSEETKAEEQLQSARRIFPGIDELLAEMEIAEQVKKPVGYVERKGKSRTHPTLEKRIRQVMKEIKKATDEGQ